jgi:hypothetical protein
MRTGFWRSVEQEFGVGKFDWMIMGFGDQQRMISSLQSESEQYRYYGGDDWLDLLAPRLVIEEAVNHAPEMVEKHESNYQGYKAIFIVEAVVEYLLKNRVEPIDRRSGDDRRNGEDRRNLSSPSIA